MPFSPRLLARLVILALLASPLALAADPAATPPAKPAAKPGTKAAAKSPAKPAAATPSHSIGVQMGESLHRAGVSDELDYDAFLAGLREGLSGKASTDEDRSAAQQFIGEIRNHLLEHNHAAAKAFLAKNGTAAGVVTTASGLQYRVVAAGDEKGAAPGPNDKVTVNYRGKLLDGTEFDSSYARGTPATFPVSGVIRGWTEALQLMKPGAKWQLFVPPELAYDANSRPPIPPGSLLVFDVELLSVAPPAPAAPANKD